MCLLLFYFGVDFLFPWFSQPQNANSPRAVAYFCSVGVIVSQQALIGFLLALFPASLFFRSIISLIAIASQVLTLMLGNYWFGEFAGIHQLKSFALAPATVLGFAIPFAVAKHYGLRWRIELNGLTSDENYQRLKISSLMGFTAICGFTLSLLKATDSQGQQLWLGAFLSTLAMGATMLFLFPATRVIATTQSSGKRMIPLSGIAACGFFGPFLLIWGVEFLLNSDEHWIKLVISSGIATFVLSYCLGLLAMFRSGLKLVAASNST